MLFFTSIEGSIIVNIPRGSILYFLDLRDDLDDHGSMIKVYSQRNSDALSCLHALIIAIPVGVLSLQSVL